jgi:hypothetical protein
MPLSKAQKKIIIRYYLGDVQGKNVLEDDTTGHMDGVTSDEVSEFMEDLGIDAIDSMGATG